MHARLALNSLSTATWSLQQDLDLYARLGVHSAGFYLLKLEGAGGLDAGVELVRASGVRATQVFTHNLDLHDVGSWPSEQDRLRRAVEAAAALGAPWLGLTAGPAGPLEWDAAVTALGRALAPVRDRAGELGVRVSIEATLPVRVELGFIHTFRDAVDVARRLGLGATLECNYFFSERDLDGTLRSAVADGALALVQVSDLVPPSTTIPDRAVPGDGVIPLARVMASAMAAGYAEPFELEILGPRIEAEGYEAAVGRSVAVLDEILTSITAP